MQTLPAGWISKDPPPGDHHALEHLLEHMCLLFRSLACEQGAVLVDGAFIRTTRGSITR